MKHTIRLQWESRPFNKWLTMSKLTVVNLLYSFSVIQLFTVSQFLCHLWFGRNSELPLEISDVNSSKYIGINSIVWLRCELSLNSATFYLRLDFFCLLVSEIWIKLIISIDKFRDKREYWRFMKQWAIPFSQIRRLFQKNNNCKQMVSHSADDAESDWAVINHYCICVTSIVRAIYGYRSI